MLEKIYVFFFVVLISSCSTSNFVSVNENRNIFSSQNNISQFEDLPPVEIIEVSFKNINNLNKPQSEIKFSQLFSPPDNQELLEPGDFVSTFIWESSPAMLFGQSPNLSSENESKKSYSEIPIQSIDSIGNIQIPFLGEINISNKSIRDAEQFIEKQLQPLANSPQVMLVLNSSSMKSVTLLGDFKSNGKYELRVGNDKLLDIISIAGGVKSKADEVALTLVRQDLKYTMPLKDVLENSDENITLQYGDVLSSSVKPFKFIALGAVNSNTDINFKIDGISLTNALALVSGWQDVRADVSNIYVLRLNQDLDKQAKYAIYSFDFRSSNGILVASDFLIQNSDVIYVSNNKTYELQKFLNLIGSVVNPITGFLNVERLNQ